MLNFRILVIFSFCIILQSCQTTMPIRIDKRGNALASASDYSEYDYDDFGESTTISDPFETVNRAIFKFNVFLLENVAAPVISFYRNNTNEKIQEMVSNVGNRVQDPMILLNSIMQLDFINASKTFFVFVSNMTIGCLGFFDPAKNLFSVEREKRDLGQTLAYYGVGNGFFVMAPIFGPYSLRDGFGLAASFYTNPVAYNGFSVLTENSWTPWYLIAPKYFAQYIDTVDGAVELNKNFVQRSFDQYIFVRDGYVQNRNYIINKIKKR